MYMRLVASRNRRQTADGLRGMWVRWHWQDAAGEAERHVCRDRIAGWLEHNGFLGYSFRSMKTAEQLRIRHSSDLVRWSRAIVDACSLFIGTGRRGPLRTGLVG